MNRHLFPSSERGKWTVDFAARSARTLALDRPVPYLARVVLLAAAYFSAAKLALLVAIPPGYATRCGRLGDRPRLGPAAGQPHLAGIWLGASLVNVAVQSSLVAATLIGAGNTLEALAGAALVRAFIGLARSVPARRGRGQIRRHRSGERDDRSHRPPRRRSPSCTL